MVEVGGRPILWHIMKGFAHHGISDFVVWSLDTAAIPNRNFCGKNLAQKGQSV